MVATTQVQRRAMIFLEAVGSMVEELEEVDGEWVGLDDAERVAWSLDWDHAMADQLGELHAMDLRGCLPEEQARVYRELLGKLTGVLPIIERLDLYRPPVPLDV